MCIRESGGMGGFGFFYVPVSQPFSVPYTIGAGGAGGTNTSTGNAGSADATADSGSVTIDFTAATPSEIIRYGKFFFIAFNRLCLV